MRSTDAGDFLGASVSLSGDGDNVAVGARGDSAATGIDGDQRNNEAWTAGAAYVF